jgi:hypothetical protein
VIRLALAVAFAALLGAACGKYGPPVRSVPERAAKTPPVAAPAPDTEECPDPERKP